jgi:hypothetical protein
MHQVCISIKYVSSVMLRPKNWERAKEKNNNNNNNNTKIVP